MVKRKCRQTGKAETVLRFDRLPFEIFCENAAD
jgi:hypothetical protein